MADFHGPKFTLALVVAGLALASCATDPKTGDGDADMEVDAGEQDLPSYVRSRDPTADGDTFEVVDCDDVNVSTTVDVVDFAFEPTDASLSAGGVIQFSHEGTSRHTIISGEHDTPDAGELFDSGQFEADETLCLRVNDAGSYPFFCDIHPLSMTGTIEVE